MGSSIRMMAVAVALASAGVLGCARSGAAPAATGGATDDPATWAAEGTAPPADSPLAKVRAGMTPREVEDILGRPEDQNAYITGKAFIPFYYGRDRGRQAYFYKGVGRVVFQGAGGFSQHYTVRFVDYDPAEDGRAQ